MRHYGLPVLAGFFLLAGQPALAQASNWQVIVQPGGYKVARVASTGPVSGIALTCERGAAVLAVSLARQPRRNPALLKLEVASGSASLRIVRNGASNIWVAAIKDSATLDMLAVAEGVSVSVDGAYIDSVQLSGADAAMRAALAGCWQAPAPAVTTGDPDEAAVRTIVGGIYGWRDGRQVKTFDDWGPLFTPRLRALIAQCEAASANADPKANNGEGAYTVTGDQGCVGSPFLLDPVMGDVPFGSKMRPTARRTGTDTIEAETDVPPPFQKDWGIRETMRFQRIGGQWLIDEVVTRTTTGTTLYSSQIGQMITDLRKIAKRPAASRKR